MESKINILVTLDKNYLYPLKIMLTSLFLNNKQSSFTIYVMHDSLTKNEIKDITNLSSKFNSKVVDVKISANEFKDAPVLLHYTKAMYFRLLAHLYLPTNLKKIIYVDPDILVLNSVEDLYNLDLKKNYYAAAYHKLFSSKTLNKNVSAELVYDFVNKNKNKLIMPDQDVLNSLFGKKIKLIDERLYNYDARHHNVYKVLSNGKFDINEVVNQTVFLHFCGKSKPWKQKYQGKFAQLYFHYQKQFESLIQKYPRMRNKDIPARSILRTMERTDALISQCRSRNGNHLLVQ